MIDGVVLGGGDMFDQIQELCRVFCSPEMSGPHLRELDSKTYTKA